jgi:hypothetical protein
MKQSEHKQWSEVEVQRLRAVYDAAGPNQPVSLEKVCAAYFPGRDKANVCRKARALGLTRQGRWKKIIQAELKLPPNRSELSKRAIAMHGHPRGMLGKKHTEETKTAFTEAVRRRWADPASKLNSPEFRQRKSDAMVGLRNAGHMRGGFHAYSRAHAGRRPDLGGLYVRSRWEANYARYLNLAVKLGTLASWEYEAETFYFEKIKRGTRSYTPDFRLVFHDGRVEWHEVKGWMDDKSRVRLERMARFYPAENVIVIGAPWFKANARRLAGLIAEWERQ